MELFDVPVLFIVFNRPETTKKVFDQIKKTKPSRLYISADGPRKYGDDEILCARVKNIVSEIDWDCKVCQLYREENLGCKLAVSGAIDWFFLHEEMGIILEDDVLPHDDFFGYCRQMLEKYKDDERVMMITGTNYISDTKYLYNHFFSEHFSIWGWATWRRAWSFYNVNNPMLPIASEDLNFLRYKFNNSYILKHFIFTFESLYDGYTNTWDIQWVYSCLLNSGLCVTPKQNLISNIGVSGTHSEDITDSHFLPVFPWANELPDPPRVHLNAAYDGELHYEKSIKVVRRKIVKKYLAQVGLLGIALKIKKLFSV